MSLCLVCGIVAGSEISEETTAPIVRAVDAREPNEPVLGVDWTIDRIDRTETVPFGAAYRITNHFGDIRLRAAEGEQFVAIGAAQYSPADEVRPVIDIHVADTTVVLEVRFPHPKDGLPDLLPTEVGKRRLDLAVLVPGAGSVAIKSLDGLVESKGLPGPLTVRSLSGALRVIAKNDLDLRCEHGDIEIFFKDLVRFPALTAETVTGDIRIEFPAGINRTVRAETNGLLVSDYSMTVDKTIGSPHKVALIPIGEGGDIIPLTSNLGTISILDQPLLTNPGSQTRPTR